MITDINLKIKTGKAHSKECFDDIMYLFNNDPGISEIFKGREDRLSTAGMLSTLYDGDKLIGFANLVKEKCDPNFLFLDVGIIEEYRGRHVATHVLESLKKATHELPQYTIVETEKDNFLANKSLEGKTKKLFEINNRNVYLLNEDRYSKFMEDGYFEMLIEHYNEPNDRMSMLEELYREEEKKGKVKIKTDKESR